MVTDNAAHETRLRMPLLHHRSVLEVLIKSVPAKDLTHGMDLLVACVLQMTNCFRTAHGEAALPASDVPASACSMRSSHFQPKVQRAQ
jgi:hypothetical protein